MANIGEMIKILRAKKGMTQLELANALETEASTVSRWESGKHTPRPNQLKAIAAALGTEVDYLLSAQWSDEKALEKRITDLEELIKTGRGPNDFNQAYLHATPKRQAVALYILTGNQGFLESLPRGDIDKLLEGPLVSLTSLLA